MDGGVGDGSGNEGQDDGGKGNGQAARHFGELAFSQGLQGRPHGDHGGHQAEQGGDAGGDAGGFHALEGQGLQLALREGGVLAPGLQQLVPGRVATAGGAGALHGLPDECAQGKEGVGKERGHKDEHGGEKELADAVHGGFDGVHGWVTPLGGWKKWLPDEWNGRDARVQAGRLLRAGLERRQGRAGQDGRLAV